MTQYNTLKAKLPNSELNKLKSGKKNCTKITLKFSSNIIVDSNNEENVLHKLLLTNTQVLRLRKAFANNSSANVKLSRLHLRKIGKSGGFLGRLLGSLPETSLPVMKYVLKALAKSVLMPLGLTVAAIHKKMFRSGTHP